MTAPYFFKMISHLRHTEDIMLYGNILRVGVNEEKEAILFLEKEYAIEALDYPYEAPPFDEGAALWAAKTVYVAAQLILYRENKNEDLVSLLPDFTGEKDAKAQLSADLCLRFLPNMVIQLKVIDSDDELIEVLENILKQWHYSAINYPLQTDTLDHHYILENACLKQLYVNRIVEYKKIKPAMLPAYRELIKANMGIYTKEFWNEFHTTLTLHES